MNPMNPASRHSFPPTVRVRFNFEALDPIRLPDYPGSAWRGLLGGGLRRTACVTRQPTCTGCLLIQSCVYSTFFETPAPPGFASRGYSALPHPFVLGIDPGAPSILAPEASFELIIHLFGPAILQVPYLIQAFRSAGERGIGGAGARGRFRLVSVDREGALGSGDWDRCYDATEGTYQAVRSGPPRVPPAPDRIRLHLVTPLRIKHGGRFVGAERLTPSDLMRALFLRLRRLAELYGGDPTGFDARTIPLTSEALRFEGRALRWHDWTRYSSRQQTLMEMGGLIGELELVGSALPDAWPALWLGQWTHVGKGTAFGLGGYRLNPETRDLPAA